MSNIPYIIESNTLTQQGQEEAWNQGIYQVGTDLWAFIIVVDQNTLVTRFGAYKSTDGLIGHAWAEQGTGPVCAGIGGGGGVSYVFDPGAGKMYAAYFQDNFLNLSLAVFTFAGTSWAVTDITGPVPPFPSNFSPNPLLQRTSGGDSLVTYWDGTDTKVVKYSGGWGSTHALGSGEKLLSAAIDASDVLHIVTFKGGGGPNVVHRTFNGSTVSASSPITSGSGSSRMGPGTYDPIADELIFPFIVGGDPGQDLILVRGTPSSGPSWTLDTAGNAGPDDSFFFPKYFKILGDDYAMCEIQSETPTEHMQLGYFKKTAGVWGSRTILWDELIDHAVPPAVDFDTPTLWSGRLLSDGSTLGVTLGLLPAGFNVLCAEQYAMLVPFSVTPPTLTLPCPLAAPGTVGMPFTETLIASGGTPPYTYAVVAGYSLPPGLTLDPATGIISGIPTTAGMFNIAFMVTDSVGTVATTIGTCPIPISGPPGAPCSNAVTNPALDSYLELRKVLVAWKKETHLPIRGKS